MVEENKQTVYIETSVVSYLMARPSGDLLAAAWQKITADWWETRELGSSYARPESLTSPEICSPQGLFGEI